MKKRELKKFFSLILLLFMILLSLNSCEISGPEKCPGVKYPTETGNQVTITQGVWGNVWFWEGDFMPICLTGKVTAVIRKVYVYEPTKFDSVVDLGGGFYSKILTKLVDSTESNRTGFFQLKLPAGKYSFFVREDTLFYANGVDGEGCILPATVVEDSITKVQIDITYKATY